MPNWPNKQASNPYNFTGNNRKKFLHLSFGQHIFQIEWKKRLLGS